MAILRGVTRGEAAPRRHALELQRLAEEFLATGCFVYPVPPCTVPFLPHPAAGGGVERSAARDSGPPPWPLFAHPPLPPAPRARYNPRRRWAAVQFNRSYLAGPPSRSRACSARGPADKTPFVSQEHSIAFGHDPSRYLLSPPANRLGHPLGRYQRIPPRCASLVRALGPSAPQPGPLARPNPGRAAAPLGGKGAVP